MATVDNKLDKRDGLWECDVFCCPHCHWMWSTELRRVESNDPKQAVVDCPNCSKTFNAELTHEN